MSTFYWFSTFGFWFCDFQHLENDGIERYRLGIKGVGRELGSYNWPQDVSKDSNVLVHIQCAIYSCITVYWSQIILETED